ncbi:MAG TPA: hypothetical protein VD861_18160 [Pyrinomonadaceae bacterium]|nr:hypothetical protein [Pyrinomonadaceae bacterium]
MKCPSVRRGLKSESGRGDAVGRALSNTRRDESKPVRRRKTDGRS